jgi:hypothetical protein
MLGCDAHCEQTSAVGVTSICHAAAPSCVMCRPDVPYGLAYISHEPDGPCTLLDCGSSYAIIAGTKGGDTSVSRCPVSNCYYYYYEGESVNRSKMKVKEL